MTRSVASFSRVRMLVAVLIVIGSTLALLAPAEAGCAWHARQTTYYSDASETTVVGQTGLDCGCNDISWGVTSPYHTTTLACCPVFTC